MNYVKLNDSGEIVKYPYTIYDLKEDNKNTSFPENTTEDILEDYNVYPVYPPTNYVYNPAKKYLEVMPTLIEGKYYQTYLEVELTQQELDDLKVNEWGGIRIRRNQYLLESDWTQLNDSPLTQEKKEEWMQYRQDLRDITTQPDPFNIVWPVKPQ